MLKDEDMKLIKRPLSFDRCLHRCFDTLVIITYVSGMLCTLFFLLTLITLLVMALTHIASIERMLFR